MGMGTGGAKRGVARRRGAPGAFPDPDRGPTAGSATLSWRGRSARIRFEARPEGPQQQQAARSGGAKIAGAPIRGSRPLVSAACGPFPSGRRRRRSSAGGAGAGARPPSRGGWRRRGEGERMEERWLAGADRGSAGRGGAREAGGRACVEGRRTGVQDGWRRGRRTGVVARQPGWRQYEPAARTTTSRRAAASLSHTLLSCWLALAPHAAACTSGFCMRGAHGASERSVVPWEVSSPGPSPSCWGNEPQICGFLTRSMVRDGGHPWGPCAAARTDDRRASSHASRLWYGSSAPPLTTASA